MVAPVVPAPKSATVVSVALAVGVVKVAGGAGGSGDVRRVVRCSVDGDPEVYVRVGVEPGQMTACESSRRR